MFHPGKGYKLTEYFQKLKRLDPMKITFDEFYGMLPFEYTKSKPEFRALLIQHSKILEKTGLESRSS